MNRHRFLMITGLIVVSLLLFRPYASASDGTKAIANNPASQWQRVTLTGIARGGVIALMRAPAPTTANFVSVPTNPGESAEVVVARLLIEMNRSDPFCWKGPANYVIESGPPVQATAQGNALILPRGGRYIFSGTDEGFEIPKPAISASASYDPNTKEITVSWINPPEPHDQIEVSGKVLPSGTTRCVFTRDQPPSRESPAGWLGVVVRRNEKMSPPAPITLRLNAQEELLNVGPFYMGLMPNWSAWCETNAAADFEQGTKKDKNITLPEDVTSITVWLRHRAADSTGVGLDWIRLEDVTQSDRSANASPQ